MALTRLYCYVHYPTDVLAGTIVGLLAGFAAAKNRRSGKPQTSGTAIAIAYLGASARIEHASRHPEAEGSYPSRTFPVTGQVMYPSRRR